MSSTSPTPKRQVFAGHGGDAATKCAIQPSPLDNIHFSRQSKRGSARGKNKVERAIRALQLAGIMLAPYVLTKLVSRLAPSVKASESLREWPAEGEDILAVFADSGRRKSISSTPVGSGTIGISMNCKGSAEMPHSTTLVCHNVDVLDCELEHEGSVVDTSDSQAMPKRFIFSGVFASTAARRINRVVPILSVINA